jgi:prepilin-type N-terminal cleavage/methylation domain-containing protein
MLPSRPDLRQKSSRQRSDGCHGVALRSAFTLVEMLIAVSILGFSAAVMSGVLLAVNSAWDFSTALEDTRRQAQATSSRMKWMVQQAGTYKLSGQSTVIGLGVIPTSWGTYMAPTTLVVWSGGSNGGMTSQGVQTRLPLAGELIIFSPDPSNPAHLVEVSFPGNSTPVDFQAASFSTTIQTLMSLPTRQTVLLSDRLHVVPSPQGGTSLSAVGSTRFERNLTPTDSQIASTAVGSLAWNSLSWGQGLVGSNQGLRTVSVRFEFLLDPVPNSSTTNSDGFTVAVPFFGSVNRQYVYQP